MLKITLKRSLIGSKQDQRLTARALGLGKVGSTVYQQDNGPIRGMIHKLNHVLAVETVEDSAAPAKAKTAQKDTKK
jgi:large subunit ribosomal protein L30